MPEEIEVFSSVLGVLDATGMLDRVILIGGWAQYLYRKAFDDPEELSALRTVDIDLLFRRPPKVMTDIDLGSELRKIGFERDFTADGSTKFVSREAEIEFLIPDRGRGDEGPYRIPELSIEAQSLRLLDMLTVDPIDVAYAGFTVKVPDPARFCFHKLLVSERRQKPEKREKDLRTAFEMLSLLLRLTEWRDLLPDRFRELPPKQRSKVLALLRGDGHPAYQILGGER